MNMISGRKEVEELFEQLGKRLERDAQALIIGGAALLEYGLKDSTKDIDIVCRTEEDKEEFLRSARELGFEIVGPERRHVRLGLNRVAIKGGHTLDIFGGMISNDFGLSEGMWSRAHMKKTFGKAEVRHASLEDIFIMKLIANREGDIEDCAALVSAGLNFDMVYGEIESQYYRAEKGTDGEQKLWITYIEEGIGRLEEDYGMSIPIADRISALAEDYRKRLYQRLVANPNDGSIREF